MWGCMSVACAEYVGAIPDGYSSLEEWDANANINAYYLDSSGNLVLDETREKELKTLWALQEIDNAPILRKDLNKAVESLYSFETVKETGDVIIIENVKNPANYMPTALFRDTGAIARLDFFAQTKQMLRNDGKTETINGVTFTRAEDGSITINGTATEDVSYNLSGSADNSEPIFGLKNGLEYYLNLNELSCEMRFFDGETTEQVYVGADGVINLSEDKNVTQVLITIPSGTTIDKTLYPMLEYGTIPSAYEDYACNHLMIDFSRYAEAEGSTIEYIIVKGGLMYASFDQIEYILEPGNIRLLDGYNFIYTTQAAEIDLECTIDVIKGNFKGNIYDPDNVKVLSEAGLLSSLQFISYGTVSSVANSFQLLGFSGFYGEASEYFPHADLELNVNIPEDFVIVEAKITIRYQPIYIQTSDASVGVWSRCSKIKLYKGTEDITWVSDGYNLNRNDNTGYEEIAGVLGSDGWTAALATNSNHPTQIKVSEDISESLSSGNQMLYLRSDREIAADLESYDMTPAVVNSGMAVAILDVIGYKKYQST